jgi:hypothetical protein
MRKLLLGFVVGAFGVLCGSGSFALAAGDANEAFCPNETLPGFASSLPDCRAYEMVSPSFKGGAGVMSEAAASSDGSRVLIQSRGIFAGASYNVGRSEYLLERSGSGWTTTAVSPPASQFAVARFDEASVDLHRTLWSARGLSQSENALDLYVREPNGSLVAVGPLVPPSSAAGPTAGGSTEVSQQEGMYNYVGASSDLSHVLFSIQGNYPLWPGDTTFSSGAFLSLYEYSGMANRQPQLVGVNGAGRLLSDCGIYLGAPHEVDVYNAMASDGRTVFFTALGQSDPFNQSECRTLTENNEIVAPEVSELWARIDGMESVPISEPSLRQCEACSVGAPKRPAIFQGASRDGSKAFFLTEQELFAGASTMNLYEYDFDGPLGRKIVRVSRGSERPEVLGVARVSQDGSHVYFVAKGALTAGVNADGAAPVMGAANLYVFERDSAYPAGRLAFVATLAEADSNDWQETDLRPVQSTPEGRYLVFQSIADLTPGDTSGEPQIFEYDAAEEKLVRVSVGQTGYAAGAASADAHGSVMSVQSGYAGREGFHPAVAATGTAVSAVSEGAQMVTRVVFSSAGALTPGAETAAAAGVGSVYEYRSIGSIASGEVYLISDPQNTTGTQLGGLDATGVNVFFSTLDQLSPQDGDTNWDLYDARVAGGFPVPPTPAGCEGEACQGTPSLARSLGAAGSMSAPAGGNLAPPMEPRPVTKPKLKPKPRPKGRHRRTVKHRRKTVRKGRKSVVNAKGRG